MLIYLKTSDLWLIDDDLVLGFLGLEIAKGTSGGQSAWKDSQRASNGIIKPIRHLSDGCGLVDLSSGLDDPLLFIDVGRFVVFADLVALAESISDQDSPRITEVGNEAGVIVDEDDNSATTAVVALLPPFTISLEEGFSQS